jgi:hypothetical protein
MQKNGAISGNKGGIFQRIRAICVVNNNSVHGAPGKKQNSEKSVKQKNKILQSQSLNSEI